jgi:hypothetical protein
MPAGSREGWRVVGQARSPGPPDASRAARGVSLESQEGC